jgi:hypothetical protein
LVWTLQNGLISGVTVAISTTKILTKKAYASITLLLVSLQIGLEFAGHLIMISATEALTGESSQSNYLFGCWNN